jgi:hypothetical protein
MVPGIVAIHATTDTTIKFLLSDEKQPFYFDRFIRYNTRTSAAHGIGCVSCHIH